MNGNYGIGGEVSDADGGVGSVDRLTAMAAGVVNIDSEVFLVDLDFFIILNDGETLDECKRGVAEIVGVEWGEADEAMDAVLGL